MPLPPAQTCRCRTPFVVARRGAHSRAGFTIEVEMSLLPHAVAHREERRGWTLFDIPKPKCNSTYPIIYLLQDSCVFIYKTLLSYANISFAQPSLFPKQAFYISYPSEILTIMKRHSNPSQRLWNRFWSFRTRMNGLRKFA
jgi:hypothetical protein